VGVKVDLVLAGCGVRGASYAGALMQLELLDPERGLEVQKVAGASAGSIAAALIAVGYRGKDLERVLHSTDFNKFRDARFLRRSYDLSVHGGIHKGDALERWVDDLVGGKCLGDVDVPLSIVAFDMLHYETVILSSETRPHLPIARAARASAAIPLFFRPVALADRLPNGARLERELVDGGVLENFPIDLFDVPGEPRWPTIGLMIDDDDAPPQNIPCLPKGPETALKLFMAIRAAYGKKLNAHNSYRTVAIPDVGVKSTEFDLTEAQKRRLSYAGAMAAAQFIARWRDGGGFEGYKLRYRA
jgi:NTE family protein